jgi:EcoRII C terminal
LKHGHLSEYFEGVGVKTLSAVDANPARSNQHEIGTTAAMKRFLGDVRRTFPTTYLWVGDGPETIRSEGVATHYDTREKQPGRSPEWRLYYDRNAVTSAMRTGETLFLATRPNGSLLFIVTPSDSSIRNQLLWLFGFHGQPQMRLSVNDIAGKADAELNFATRRIINALGIEYNDPNTAELDSLIDQFGTKFPSTAAFSGLARQTLPDVRAADDPDGALMAWLDREEAMFRRLEHRVMADRIAEGFENNGSVDVDGFIGFSLSVQNRRKSRMGLSLENHLEAIFQDCQLSFTKQAMTERGSKVDFLFPSVERYHDDGWSPDNLITLAAKATCKDRWRQVLAEAEKVRRKHLITLEPAISASQTAQMQALSLQLVIPKRLHESYNPQQRSWIWSLTDFISFVRESEVRWNGGRNWLPLGDFIRDLDIEGLDLSRDPDYGRDVEL